MAKQLFNKSILVLLLPLFLVSAKDATALQFMFTVKKIFPDAKNVSVFMPTSTIDKEKSQLTRASAQAGLKTTVFGVNNYKDIGEALRKIDDGSVLVMFTSASLMDKSSKMFILTKCKKKQIKLVTSSKEYSDSGALLGIIPSDDHKTELILNLKHSAQLADRFTPETIKELGITTVIR